MRIRVMVLSVFALGIAQVVGAQGRCPYAGGSSVGTELPTGYQRAIHVIEQTSAPGVLSRPASLASAHGSQSKPPAARVAERLLTDRRFSQLASLIRATGLRWPEDSAAGITVLAPTNSALATISEQRLTELASDPVALRGFLDRHAIPGALSRTALADRAAVLSLGHRSLLIEVGDQLKIGRVTLDQTPLVATDGVIHPIERPVSD